ncbi:RNA polymerase sigma-70 factor (ECF subfamily) [Actinoalloteichus hoggarensis]|uniref:ECF RNA polymerase sigma factor SigK n=1 Tax=Actinoalloteichus hoggarensis TaxID=1470176 RepID=A0A221W770_9PSEU|nr:ECF RNA polymerase sigma factor SigK [Actinoalloteichus hoggarensis]MBB5922142.1 RNA polymerase sigma-70 factor (ECF subfamily) [Actinoalloteichus hoggarensis]
MTQGDAEAFAELFDRYSRQAYSLARRLCVDPGIAEDVVQEAFLDLWRRPHGFRADRGSFSTWLLTLVHHRAVDAVRRESALRRRTAAEADAAVEEAVGGPDVDQEAMGRVVGGQVQEALRRLPDEQRQAIALAYYGGYTQGEVAAFTGVPLGTVKSRTFAGVRRLRGLLSSLLNTEEPRRDGTERGDGRE